MARHCVPVKITRDAKVSALQKAIFDDQRYNERFLFPPSELTHYLARKNKGEKSKWLKDDRPVKDFLRDGLIRLGWRWLTKAGRVPQESARTT
ncbi:hypothetical protein GQ600_12265 [Phytophthora cactorum]|nr:hypothetical protein GQ600_12265 [Phytophthora cactorum]